MQNWKNVLNSKNNRRKYTAGDIDSLINDLDSGMSLTDAAEKNNMSLSAAHRFRKERKYEENEPVDIVDLDAVSAEGPDAIKQWILKAVKWLPAEDNDGVKWSLITAYFSDVDISEEMLRQHTNDLLREGRLKRPKKGYYCVGDTERNEEMAITKYLKHQVNPYQTVQELRKAKVAMLDRSMMRDRMPDNNVKEAAKIESEIVPVLRTLKRINKVEEKEGRGAVIGDLPCETEGSHGSAENLKRWGYIEESGGYLRMTEEGRAFFRQFQEVFT